MESSRTYFPGSYRKFLKKLSHLSRLQIATINIQGEREEKSGEEEVEEERRIIGLACVEL